MDGQALFYGPSRTGRGGGKERWDVMQQSGEAVWDSISTAINWVQRVRETGSVAPGKIGGYRPKSISGEHRTWLLQRIKQGDFTLRGLVTELAERGLKVDYRTVWNFVHSENLSFKKKRGGRRARSSRRRTPARPMGQVPK